MYSIYSDDVCIHEDIYALPEYKVIGAKLTMEENAAGSLTLTIPPQNVGYSTVKRMSSVISVRRNGEEIWSGRVVDEKEDFWKRRQLTCEGELGYLNDSIQPPAEYTGLTIRGFLEKVLSVHNASVEADKRFQLGAVTQMESGKSFTWRTNYENTMQCVSGKLVEEFGGRIRVRKVNGIRYLDYLAEYPNTNSQIVEFGKNLLDFTKSWDLTELVTVVIPRGKKLEKSPIKDMEAYTTVESVNNGSIKVVADTASQFGYIELVVDWSDISDPAQLLEKAKEYLKESQFETMVLKVSMVDLHLMSGSEEPVNLLDQLRCRSYLHGMDKVFPVTKIVLPLDHPEQAEYTLGKSERVGLAEGSKKTSSDILAKIEALPTKESILTEAKENADAIINMATNGYITITKGEHGTNELYISDTQDYKAATRYWRWNLNGLAYYNKAQDRLPKIALTMDGAIVADFITTGTMSADRIRTGVLESINKNTVFNLNTGELTMRKGSIYIGKGADGSTTFSVDTDGNLYARRGTFAGTLSAAKGTFAGDLQAAGGTFTGNLTAAGGTFKGDLQAAGGTFSGNLSAAGGTFKGELQAAKGTFAGDISAASGTFTGTVKAAKFLDLNGNDMMSNGKFKSDYLELKGIKITDTHGNTTFEVSRTGVVTIQTTALTNLGNTVSSIKTDMAGINLSVTDNSSKISSISTTLNNMRLSVSNESASSTIYLESDRMTLSSATIEFTGMVTFRDVEDTIGRTTIDGGQINTNTLYLDTLYGSSIYLRTDSGRYGEIAAEIRTTGAGTARTAFDLWARAVRINANEGDCYLHSEYGAVTLAGDGGNTCIGDFYPNRSGSYTCGTWSFLWRDIYAENDIIQTSDRSVKKDINYDITRYDAFFDALRPVSFRFVDGNSGRTHIGLISQDVETALKDSGLTDMDFAGFVRNSKQDGDAYALRYGEFTALLIEQIQALKARVALLEKGI